MPYVVLASRHHFPTNQSTWSTQLHPAVVHTWSTTYVLDLAWQCMSHRVCWGIPMPREWGRYRPRNGRPQRREDLWGLFWLGAKPTMLVILKVQETRVRRRNLHWRAGTAFAQVCRLHQASENRPALSTPYTIDRCAHGAQEPGVELVACQYRTDSGELCDRKWRHGLHLS